ncbi:MAG: hypothetical protein B193_3094 [Solidesulfovibrio magneticus str. Maddingley MBC34]|uniref:DUF1565 domain-containing protein n=1 Tax=Solidesulfovibrio magneticus str. Maddingley MBC34 TaxID=1206767 RepID=K6FHZ2_9BACT|nr:MAG: hypothetical protein B193_3094 [Solidesulfovibrio magneticus str. Maddingley MBC34]
MNSKLYALGRVRGAACCFLALAALLLLHVAPAGAVTRYVDAAVASSGDGASWTTAFKTIQDGLNAAASGDTVEVAGGTYAESLTTVTAGVTVAGSTASGKNGPVRVLGPADSSVLTVSHQTVWRRLTFDGSQNAADWYVVRVSSGAPTFDQCVIGPGQRLLNISTGGATFTRTTLQEARWAATGFSNIVYVNAGAAAPVTFDYCLFGDMQFGYINIATASQVAFNNCLLAGFLGEILYVPSGVAVSGGVNLTNCLAMGNGYATQALIINDSSSTAVTLTNCLIQDMAPVNMNLARFAGNVTEVSPLSPGSPKLAHGRRPALLNLGIDDAEHIPFFAQVAALANSTYGMKMTSAVDAADASDANWTTLQPLVNAGNEVAAHSAHHVYLPETKLMTLTYSGPGTNVVVAVAGGGTGTPATSLAVSATGDSVANFSLDLSAPTSIGDICGAINAKSGFTCGLITETGTSYTSGPVLARDLAQVAGVSIKNVTATLLRDDAQFFADEIAAPKATIEHKLSAASGGSYACTSFVYPFLGENPTVRAAVAGAGYLAARNGYNGFYAMGGFYSGTTPSGYDALDIWAVQPGAVFGNLDKGLTPEVMAQRVSAFLEWAKFTGAAVSLFSHGEDEYSLSEWSALLALIAADPDVTVTTLAGIQAYLAANAQSAVNLVYTRTVWPDVADYQPLAGSPLLDAGAAYAAAKTDFGGQLVPAGTIPSVGLYQRGTASSGFTPAPLMLLLLQ